MLHEIAGTGTVVVAAIVVGVTAAVFLGKRRRGGENEIAQTVNAAELRRKRIATLSSQVNSDHAATSSTAAAAAAAAAPGPATPEVKSSPKKETKTKKRFTRKNLRTKRAQTAQERAEELRNKRGAFVAAAASAAAAAAAAPPPPEDAGSTNQQQTDGSNSSGSSSPSIPAPDRPASAPADADTPQAKRASASRPGTASASLEGPTQPAVSAVASEGLHPSSPEGATDDASTNTGARSTKTSSACPNTVPDPLKDLPGRMQLDDLLELLASGSRSSYDALCTITSAEGGDAVLVRRSQRKSPAGPETAAGVCRRWWDAAWGAGKAEVAGVAADVLGLHLEAMQDDLFTSAEEQRAALLLAFLGTSPSPLMVRRVFSKNPSAAKATLRLAVSPVVKEREAPTTTAPMGQPAIRSTARARAAAAAATAAAAAAAAASATTVRLELWQPLEGLESLERLFRSAAGAAALAVVLGLEARQEYAHGAELEAESVMGPLLGGLSCVLSLKQHFRAASEFAHGSALSSRQTLGNQLAQHQEDEAWSKMPVTHRLAKMLADSKAAGPRARNALIHKFNASYGMKAKNRQSFVALVEAALVKAMTTKGVSRESKSDVCAWLSKAIFLHEGVPHMCNERGPELLGTEGSTCASSAFLMSLTALLLRMGVAKFSSVRPENMDSIDIGYVEGGPVRWGSDPLAALADEDDDDDEDGEVDGKTDRKDGDSSTSDNEERKEGDTPAPSHGGTRGEGVEEEKGREAGEEQESPRRGEAAPATDGADSAAERTALFERTRRAPLSTSDGGTGQQQEHKEQREEEEDDQQRRRGFTFATELFFLTHRALQVIIGSLERRQREMHKTVHETALAQTGFPISVDGAEGAGDVTAGGDSRQASFMLGLYKEANSAISLGWNLEGFGSDAVTGNACHLATFTACWLGLFLDRDGDDGVGGDGAWSQSPASATSSKILPPLIETMCASWVRGASYGRPDQFLNPSAAEDAAIFCGQLMERVDLRLPPVTQGKLVEVLETLMTTGTSTLDRDRKGSRTNGGSFKRAIARSGGFKGSMYWGNRRGYAGAILDSEELRRSLPRQLMRLYSSVHAVDGLSAEDFLGGFKMGVWIRVGSILLQLWSHPLGEPRQAILDIVRASIAATATNMPTPSPTPTIASSSAPSTPLAESTGGGGGGGGGESGGAGGTTAEDVNKTVPLATNFFINAFGMIMFCVPDALDRLRDGVIEERGNGGRPIETEHAHWRKYMFDRKSVRSSLEKVALPVLKLLNTLGEERDVMHALRIGTLGARSAALISIVFSALYGEESAAFAVADPRAWGFDKAELGRATCELLVGLTEHGSDAAAKIFAAALHEADGEFNGDLLKAAAAAEGGECLRGGSTLPNLLQALEEDDNQRRKAEEQAAVALEGGEKGGTGAGGDPFGGIPATGADGVDASDEKLVQEYGDALSDLVHTQVESLSPGHCFDGRREGSTLTQPRKVATEIMRRLPRTLPNPPHPNSAVFAVVEEDALNFSRFVISGPSDTPYEGGLFVFDVFLPPNYPADPPLVQNVTTGQGTVRFNVNLYPDGKVCLSLLGKDSGESAAGGDKWNPDTSSLWQVFASIQTMVLVKDPYYNEGGGRSNMRGRGTAETEEASAHENARVTLETIRHAAVGNLRHPPRGCEELVRRHFGAVRNRMLARCRKAVQQAPNERMRRATLRASAELRAEMDKLLV